MRIVLPIGIGAYPLPRAIEWAMRLGLILSLALAIVFLGTLTSMIIGAALA